MCDLVWVKSLVPPSSLAASSRVICGNADNQHPCPPILGDQTLPLCSRCGQRKTRSCPSSVCPAEWHLPCCLSNVVPIWFPLSCSFCQPTCPFLFLCELKKNKKKQRLISLNFSIQTLIFISIPLKWLCGRKWRTYLVCPLIVLCHCSVYFSKKTLTIFECVYTFY